jgi:hypothetical protein
MTAYIVPFSSKVIGSHDRRQHWTQDSNCLRVIFRFLWTIGAKMGAVKDCENFLVPRCLSMTLQKASSPLRRNSDWGGVVTLVPSICPKTT